MLFAKKILVMGRTNATNFGDAIIADTCEYIIKKCAKEDKKRVQVKVVDVYEQDLDVWRNLLKKQNIVVYPGGGLNSVKFNHKLLKIFKVIAEKQKIQICFNAIGLLENNVNPKNEEILKKLLNHTQVKQVTTRGSYDQLKKYMIKDKKYPATLVFDPAIWTGETYQIERNKESEIIGVGIIRPGIFMDNKNDFTEKNVFSMYEGIIRTLQQRGYRWQLFTNGYADDYEFAKEFLERMGLSPAQYLGKKIVHQRQLVEQIAKYKAVIAARLHANIIATSLGIPSVALVWNEKMNYFAEIIGREEQYIQVEKLLDAAYIVDMMEKAIDVGYDTERIEKMKEKTISTIRNIYS